MEDWAGGEFLLCREKTWVGVRGWGNRKGERRGLRTAPSWAAQKHVLSVFRRQFTGKADCGGW